MIEIPNLSLLQNPTLVFDNTVGANELSVNLPITYKDTVIGIITTVSEEKIYCTLWDKFIRFYPEFIKRNENSRIKFNGIEIQDMFNNEDRFIQLNLNNEPDVDV